MYEADGTATSASGVPLAGACRLRSAERNRQLDRQAIHRPYGARRKTVPPRESRPEPRRIRLRSELKTVRLRDFSTVQEGVATLLCAPYALHGAGIVDLAPWAQPGYGPLRAAGAPHACS